MDIVELILDEEAEGAGVFAISIVENPAIESDFIALSKEYEVKFAEVSKEKKILLGPALIPNKMIYRKEGEREYSVYFSEDTIERTSQLFFKNGRQGESTLEHEMHLSGLTVVQSWLVDDPAKDKVTGYGLDVPKGTWMVAVKVDNEDIWEEFVKSGKVKGFSIEGYFAEKGEKVEKQEQSKQNKLRDEVVAMIENFGK